MGRWFDRLVFRPFIGWATAWSFDRLRLWIEQGIAPSVSMRQSLLNLIARLSLALIWLYEGIVPKLIFRHPDEYLMLHAARFSDFASRRALIAVGWIEVAVGLLLILAWRSALAALDYHRGDATCGAHCRNRVAEISCRAVQCIDAQSFGFCVGGNSAAGCT